MDLTKISNNELLVRLEKLAKSERKITHLVLWHISEMETRKLYADLGFSTMYEYLTKHLGYGESSAYRRIQSARLLKQIPHLAEKLEEGSLNLTQLTQVQKCLKAEKKLGTNIDIIKTSAVLAKIENKSNLVTQKVLAFEFNQLIQMHEVAKPQRNHSTRLEITFTEEQMKVLQKSKEHLSHILPEATWAEVITFLAQRHVEKIEGKSMVKQKPKQVPKDPKSTQSFFIRPKRSHIKITTKRALLLKANNCCEYQDPVSGKKCESHYQLQVDHKVPLARGGNSTQQNLRVLCRTHNLLAARKWGLENRPS